MSPSSTRSAKEGKAGLCARSQVKVVPIGLRNSVSQSGANRTLLCFVLVLNCGGVHVKVIDVRRGQRDHPSIH